MEDAGVRIYAVMSGSLDSVVDVDYQKMPLPEAVAGWDLPRDALDALTRWGLPVIPGLFPFFQVESEPVLIPNLAGERERSIASLVSGCTDSPVEAVRLSGSVLVPS
jgi:hypothetical protein